MAVTADVINGTDLLLYDNTHPFAGSTTCSMQVSNDMRDTTNKDSAGWKTVLPGGRSWTISCEGLVSFDQTYNYVYLLNFIINKTRIALKFKTSNASDTYFSGYAYLTSISMDAGNNANTTFSAQFQGDGALTITGATP